MPAHPHAGRTALITGASMGIGADLAAVFAENRWNLVLTARSEEKLQQIATDLQAKHGITAEVLPADLTNPAAPDALRSRLAERGHHIDALVNNAGFGGAGEFSETNLQHETNMIQVNITALTQLTKLLLLPMLERKQGWILNVASTAGFQPGPLMAVYYATKAYVLSFSEALAQELEGSGVLVSALCPGPTSTGFAAAADMENRRLFKLTRPMSSRRVAEAGYEGLLGGKTIVIPGLKNKLGVQSLRISPRAVVRRVVKKLQEPVD